MKKDIKAIKQVLEEHLSSINESSSEIQALFDYLKEVESKVDKFSERLDQMQLKDNHSSEKISITPLTTIEKKVFLVLYTEETPLSYKEIAVKAQLPNSLVPECISSLVQKGIALHRTYFNDKLFLKLDPQFKEVQAKENLINLSLQSFME